MARILGDFGPQTSSVPMREPVYSLQMVRALAAGMVVVAHLGSLILRKTGQDFTPGTDIGGAGVDLFFVVSGFVMIHTTGREFGARDFLTRRLIRIAPLYWLATLLYGLTVLAAPRLFAVYRLKPDNFFASFFFLPSFNMEGSIRPPLEQGWTLAYEMFFYLCFAVASRTAFTRRIALMGLVFSALVLLGRLFPDPDSAIVTTYSDPILLEFVAGCALAALYARNKLNFSKATALALIGAAIVGLFVSPELMRIHFPRLVYWGVPAFLAVLGLLRLERFVAFERFHAAQALGDSSYSLYVSHLFVLAVLGLAFHQYAARNTGVLALAPFAIVLCLSIGWLCYQWIEKPLTGLARRCAGAEPRLTQSQAIHSGRR
jgi:peptidoglycan/LPS O-acetylase OafA/YrhL